MNIKIFVSKAGRIILTSDTYFNEPVQSILFDYLTRRIYLKFTGEAAPYTLNCEVDDYIAHAMAEKDTCGFGFEKNGQLEDAVFLPLFVAHREEGLKGDSSYG